MSVSFRIRMCTKYGRRPAAWGSWIDGSVADADAYESLLNRLCADKQVRAFEAERLPDRQREWWQSELYADERQSDQKVTCKHREILSAGVR
jgi:hypothetical protein